MNFPGLIVAFFEFSPWHRMTIEDVVQSPADLSQGHAIDLAGKGPRWLGLVVDIIRYGYESKPWYPSEPQITGKWMFIPPNIARLVWYIPISMLLQWMWYDAVINQQTSLRGPSSAEHFQSLRIPVPELSFRTSFPCPDSCQGRRLK